MPGFIEIITAMGKLVFLLANIGLGSGGSLIKELASGSVEALACLIFPARDTAGGLVKIVRSGCLHTRAYKRIS
jgi:hypothetical protein